MGLEKIREIKAKAKIVLEIEEFLVNCGWNHFQILANGHRVHLPQEMVAGLREELQQHLKKLEKELINVLS